jgi:hypothetical protein
VSKALVLGLVVSGPTRPDILLRLPLLLSRLGPVKAPTVQQASRVCNALRRGQPAKSWEQLAGVDAVLVTTRAQDWSATARSMADVGDVWRGVPVVWAGEPMDLAGSALAASGARMTTACAVEATPPIWICCGSKEAQRLLRAGGANVVAVDPARAGSYRQATGVFDSGLPQVMELGCRRLAEAGLHASQARAVVEARTGSAVRYYLRNRRRPKVDDALRDWGANL